MIGLVILIVYWMLLTSYNLSGWVTGAYDGKKVFGLYIALPIIPFVIIELIEFIVRWYF